jgi:hypothetical protein
VVRKYGLGLGLFSAPTEAPSIDASGADAIPPEGCETSVEVT